MQLSGHCLLVPAIYLSILLSFECVRTRQVLVKDSKERPDLYPRYFWQSCTVVVWGTVGLSAALWLLSTITNPGKLQLDSTSPQARLCRVCNLMRGERTHHCSKCGRCVEDMDHHCSYLSNCVGRRNRKYFLLFLSTSCPGGLIYLFLLSQYSFGHIAAEPIPSQFSSSLSKLAFGLTSLVQFLFVLLVLALTGTQHYLLLRNMTTLEMIKEMKSSKPRWCWEWEAQYDEGVIPNYRQVFGSSLSEWCLPTPPYLVPSTLLPFP